MHDNGFIRLKDVLQIFKVSESTYRRGMKAGIFPKPIKLNMGVKLWRLSDITEFIENAKNED
ncbi:AlpA family phage regulatory protein [Deferribacteraceae bacterium V6Fe1]|nr:AlpA family phage regulatory protein [Deferribacteraceae bacterium V6Fe1]